MADYIDRQAAIDAINNLSDIIVYNPTTLKYAVDAEDAINEVPSADVQPVRHGKMRDYIDRQAAIDEAYAVIVDDAVYDVVQVETLEGLPSVDAVEVVRCKDCIYGHRCFNVHRGVTDSWVNCRNPKGLNQNVMDDAYCSYGERKR